MDILTTTAATSATTANNIYSIYIYIYIYIYIL
jgi:hypothetical protein